MDIENITVEVSTKLFECGICAKQYQSKGALKRHLRRHTDENKFVCNQCDKAFDFKYLLSRHEKVHDSGAMKERHMCEVCGKSFCSTGALSDHKKFKHLNEGFLCTTCDKIFKNPYHLRRHIGTHQNDKKVCKNCGGYFRQLKNHEKTCSRESSVPAETCHVCGKKFLEKRYLKEHMKYKHSPITIICEVCGKNFHNRKTMLKHKKKCKPETEQM